MDFALGAQTCHWEEKGAFTGEVSPLFLAKLNVVYVIAGHSERRELFGETDEQVNLKVKAILKAGMTPIMCCGETDGEREAGEAQSKVEGQIRAGLAGIPTNQVAAMVVAYEPIWAIGTGKTATPEDAQEMCALVRRTVADVAGADAGAGVRVQYGGSVKSGNAAELMGQPDIDGALVGGASLDADEFAHIVEYQRS
jgi:triosephosphate isomerase